LWTRTPKERVVAGSDATRSKEPSAIATVACRSARAQQRSRVRRAVTKKKKGSIRAHIYQGSIKKHIGEGATVACLLYTNALVVVRSAVVGTVY
jgi:hypothetical protein